MKASDLEADLTKLSECDLVHYAYSDGKLSLLAVGDNDPEEEHKEAEDKDEDGDDDCCGEMNGHLFELLFYGVEGFEATGKECDTYRVKKSVFSGKNVRLDYEGMNLGEKGNDVTVAFSYDHYEVLDHGKIEGPDV